MLVADQRSLRYAPAVLSWQPTDGTGAPLEVSGTVTVTVTRDSDGSSVTVGSVSGSGNAPRTATVGAAETALLDVLTATWSVDGVVSGVTTCEIVGGFIASVATIRDRARRNVTTDKDLIVQVRDEVEAHAEDTCRVAFVPRYAHERVRVPRSTEELLLPHVELRVVRSATLIDEAGNETALTDAQCAAIAPSGGGIARRGDDTCWPCGWVDIVYEHGYDRPDQDLVRQFIDRVTHRLAQRNTAVPPAATQINQDGQVINLDPSTSQWFGTLKARTRASVMFG